MQQHPYTGRTTLNMKKIHTKLFPMLLVLLLTAAGACSTEENSTEIADANDCVVTGVTLGTLKRIMHTTNAAGEDSTYTVNVVGSYYPMSIDQVNARIYNLDSLPVGTDLSRVTFSSFTTSGVATIHTLTTDIDTVFSTTDSTDFRTPRYIKVHAYDGQAKKTYRVEINAHSEEADSFNWHRLLSGDETLSALEGATRLATTADGTTLVYATRDGRPVVLSAATPGEWTETMLPAGFATTSVVASTDRTTFYALDGSDILMSFDGTSWTGTGSSIVPDAIIAVGTGTITALKDGHFVSTTDGGATWVTDEADEPQYLPVTDAQGIVIASKSDAGMENYLAIGRTADDKVVAWRRTVDLTGTNTFGWFYLTENDVYAVNCPDLTSTSLFIYDDYTVLVGQTADGTASPIYESHDNGRTWAKSDVSLPGGISGTTANIAACADATGNIRLVDTTTGSLWTGRYNRMAWDDTPTSFEKSRKK